jgi:four helix bundle protein
MDNKKFDLEDRLAKFECMCLDVCNLLPDTKTGQNLAYQLSKSSTSSALVYGEAQAAESKGGFIHKMKVVLKEIGESGVNLRMIIEKRVIADEKVQIAFKEANGLMAIFLKSIETAKQNKIASTFKSDSYRVSIPYFLFLISFVFSAILFSSKIVVAQSIPSFSMQLTNGKLFSAKDLSHEKPVIIIYFAPDCEHCQTLMNVFFKKIQDFKKAQIVMVTFKPVNEVVDFERSYQTIKYPNIKVGTEIPLFFFRGYYHLENTPFTVLYDRHGKLIISYIKQTPVDDLIKHLKVL